MGKVLNVEIKARCKNQDKVRDYLKESDAYFKGLDHQIDTYFNVSNGRLKLREGNIEYCLIHYERDNQEGPKESDVTMFDKPNDDLKSVLEKALGEMVVVDKEREIYFIGNVKFHIDKVKDLGDFVEIEAQDPSLNMTKDSLLEQCEFYMGKFGIKDEDLVECSYSDLLLEKFKNGE